MDYLKSIVSEDVLRSNSELCKEIIRKYDDAKEKNASWFGPKIPFYITMPKLIDNANKAKKILREIKSGYGN